MKITEENYQQTISKNEYDRFIRKILQEYLYNHPNTSVIELRKQEKEISCYILGITQSSILEYKTTKTFFKNIYKKELIRLVGSFGHSIENTKHGLFVATDMIQLNEYIIKEINNKTKPTKKQIGVLTKAYKKIIYKNTLNSQFYIIPSINERRRSQRYEHVHKNTVESLIKKGLIQKQIGQIYQITSQAQNMLETKAAQELTEKQINIKIEEWINTPKLMQEYITRIKEKKNNNHSRPSN